MDATRRDGPLTNTPPLWRWNTNAGGQYFAVGKSGTAAVRIAGIGAQEKVQMPGDLSALLWREPFISRNFA